MARKRRTRKQTQNATKGKITNDSLETKGECFFWNNERSIALLQCMTRRKPAGLHKHLSVLLIKSHLSKRLKMDVPIKAIWRFLDTHWDMHAADKLEYQVLKIEKKDFELPQTEEWTQLIEEQKALININNTKSDAIKQTSQAVTSNVDLKTLKSVKVMVEKLDSHSLYVNELLKIK